MKFFSYPKIFQTLQTPATFCRLVDALFGPEFEPNVIAYLEDIIIVSKTYEEHLEWLKFVLDKMVAVGLKVNPEKCEFCCSRVTYLGFTKPLVQHRLAHLVNTGA